MTGLEAAIMWLIIAGAFFVVESMTYQLICIWFMAGAIGSMIVSFMGLSFTSQLWIFFIVSIAFLVLARPLLKSKLKVKAQPTNADRVIGMVGVVTETIDNYAATGRAQVNGLSWTARARDDAMKITPNEKVRVLAIEGVKLIVEPLTEATAQ